MKLENIERTFKNDPIAKEVAYMIATSHEYKTPNEKGAIKLVSNYKWEKRRIKTDKLQGINKPVNKEKVFDMAKTLKEQTLKPFMVVDKFQGITPQSPGCKILIDGHHRKEACEFKGIKEVPIYYGKYTGKAEKTIDEIIESKANSILSGFEKIAKEEVLYHASPVQDIKKFKRFEDTSGNNKGKVIFASKEPSFTVAFGVKWNDGNARMDIQTTNNKAPNKDNYVKTVLRVTDKINLDAPCSMYKLKGDFEYLRYPGDLEEITNKDVEIISEEKFNNFRDMAKAYGLDLREVSENHILNKLKGKKSSNFEKKAMNKSEGINKLAGLLSRKDITHNKPNKNVTLITGYSGSGKTTLGNKMKNKSENNVLVELDGFPLGYDTSGDENIVNDFLKKHRSLINKQGVGDYDKMEPLIWDHIDNHAKANPSKHYYVEGMQILGEPELLNKYPFVIKGTGSLKSSYRRHRRNPKCSIADSFKYNSKLDDRYKNTVRTAKAIKAKDDLVEKKASEILKEFDFI